MSSHPPASRRARALCALAVLVAAPASAEPMPAEPPHALTILVTTGLGGQLVDAQGNTLAAVASALQAERARAENEGRAVVVVDAGRTLVPFAESREEGGKTTMQVLAAGGSQAFLPGPMDLSLGRSALVARAREHTLPVVLPHLAGESPAPELLAAVSLEPVAGLALRLQSAFDPRFEGELRLAGFEPRTETLPENLGGPDAIDLVVVHSNGAGRETRSRTLSWNLLDDPRGADILFDPDMGHDLFVRSRVDGRDRFLVGYGRESWDWRIVRIDATVLRDTEGLRLTDVSSNVLSVDPNAPVDAALEERILARWERFRTEHAIPLSVHGPEDYDELRTFVLAAMRENTRAEIAILNRGGLRPVAERFLAGERLTREAVLRMLSIDQRLQVVEMTGRELESLAKSSARRVHPDGSPRSDSLEFLGLEHDDFVIDITVNGRPLSRSDHYRVVTNSYLLAGGDDHAVLTGLEGTVPEHEAPELRNDVVLPRLERAEEPFVDLARRPLWRYGVDDLSLLADGVETDADTAYESSPDSRASADSSVTIRSRLRFRLDLDRSRWRWENRLRSTFGLVKIDGETREVADDLVFDSSMVFLHTDLLGGSPFAGFTLDTELRQNRNALGEKIPRQLEETLSMGLAWETPLWSRIRLGAVAREYPQLDRPTQLGLKFEADFEWLPLKANRPEIDLSILAEHLEESDSSTQRASLEARFFFPLIGDLSLSPGFDVYWLEDSDYPGAAHYYRLSVGLAYGWSDKHQAW